MLRHVYATSLLTSNGADIIKCTERMGHQDIKTTMIYKHRIDPKADQEEANDLAEVYGLSIETKPTTPGDTNVVKFKKSELMDPKTYADRFGYYHHSPSAVQKPLEIDIFQKALKRRGEVLHFGSPVAVGRGVEDSVSEVFIDGQSEGEAARHAMAALDAHELVPGRMKRPAAA